jgi:hypothetical protein
VYQIEVLRSRHRGCSLPTWQVWQGWPPGDLATQEERVVLLRLVWPLWQFRVVMALEAVAR